MLRAPGPAAEQADPAKWVDWQPAMKVESPPPAAEPPPRRRRRYFRPKRRPLPWIFLIVGLLVGLASIGLLIVLIVALWPTGKGEKSATEGIPLPGWQEIVSAEGRFRVLMPGKPKIEERVDNTRLGSLDHKSYTLNDRDYSFMVGYGDLDSEELQNVSPDEWIHASRDAYLNQFREAKLLNQKSVSLHGYQGKEWRYDIPGKVRVILRTYAVNRRVYGLFIIRDKQEPAADVVARFFDSFQIMD